MKMKAADILLVSVPWCPTITVLSTGSHPTYPTIESAHKLHFGKKLKLRTELYCVPVTARRRRLETRVCIAVC